MKARLLVRCAMQGVAAGSYLWCPAVEEQAHGLVLSLCTAALLVGPPWVMVNGLRGKWWQGDWELALLVDGEHAEEVLVVLVLVLLA